MTDELLELLIGGRSAGRHRAKLGVDHPNGVVGRVAVTRGWVTESSEVVVDGNSWTIVDDLALSEEQEIVEKCEGFPSWLMDGSDDNGIGVSRQTFDCEY